MPMPGYIILRALGNTGIFRRTTTTTTTIYITTSTIDVNEMITWQLSVCHALMADLMAQDYLRWRAHFLTALLKARSRRLVLKSRHLYDPQSDSRDKERSRVRDNPDRERMSGQNTSVSSSLMFSVPRGREMIKSEQEEERGGEEPLRAHADH